MAMGDIYRYPVVITYDDYSDEYEAFFPDFPDIEAHYKTMETLNIIACLKLKHLLELSLLQGKYIPTSTDIADVRKNHPKGKNIYIVSVVPDIKE